MAWGQGRNTRLINQAKRTIPRHCAQCGTTEQLELDHVIPLSEHGADDITNVQWLCHTHHAAKTKTEAARGRTRHHARRYRPAEPHPGRVTPS